MQVLAEQIDRPVPVLVAVAGRVRRDQHARIAPQRLRRQVFKLAHIYIQYHTAQMPARQRLGQRRLVHDLAAGDVDQHDPRLHRCKPRHVDQIGGLRRPLTADHHEVALAEKPVEIISAAEYREPRRQRRVRLRPAPRADDAHAEGGSQPTDLATDPAGADHAHGLAFQQQRSIGAMVELARRAIAGGAIELLGEVQDAGDRVFRHGEDAADAARRRHRHVAAPKVADA